MPTVTTVACPSCKASLKVGASQAGKKIRCSKCKKVFAPGAAPRKPAAPAAAAAPKVACPGCKTVLKVPASFPPGKKIKCPKCAKAFAPTSSAGAAAAPAKPAAKAASNGPAAKAPAKTAPVKPSANGPATKAPVKPIAKAPSAKAPPARAPLPKPPVKAPTPKPPPEPEPPEEEIDEQFEEPAAPPPVKAPPRPMPAKKPAELDEDELAAQKRNRLMLIALGVAVVLGAGYYYLFLSSPPARLERTVYTVEGVVTYKGKPVDGAQITYFPVEQSKDTYRPRGTTEPDGSYKLTTYSKDDGAPPGKYNVSVLWLTAPKTPAKGSNDPFSAGGQRVDRLQNKYGDAASSGLNAEVKAEPNKINFDLTK